MFQLLLVEDNPRFRQSLAETLHARFPDIRIIQLESGEQALSRTATSAPDLIIMDIRLGGKNGLQAARELKERYPTLDIALLSNHDLPEYRRAALSAGACCLISKNDDYATQIGSLLAERLPAH